MTLAWGHALVPHPGTSQPGVGLSSNKKSNSGKRVLSFESVQMYLLYRHMTELDPGFWQLRKLLPVD